MERREDRVGGFLTVPPSHTTGHTDRVPRRFPWAFNAVSPRQGSFPLPRRVSLLLRARPRPGSAGARAAVAHRCLQDLIKEVQLLAGALLPRRCHRVALVCSLAQRFSPSRLPSWSGATMASADSSAAIGCRRRHPTPVIRRAEEASHGKTLHFLGATAGFTRARDGRSIGRPRPWPGCPTALALYPISVRRPPDLPPASSPPRIAATQLPLAIGSAPCGPKRTFTSKFSAMRGTPWIPAFAGKTVSSRLPSSSIAVLFTTSFAGVTGKC